MPALPAGAGKIGDLILGVAPGFQRPGGGQIQIGRAVLVRQTQLPGGKGGARLDLQQIGRDVGRPQLPADGGRTLDGFRPLAGQAQHHVEGQVIEPCPHGVPDGALHVGGGMPAAKEPQLVRIGGLHPQGKAAAAGGGKGPQSFVQIVSGVGLQGDLRVPQAEDPAGGLHQAGQPGAAQQGGGAAADIQGVRLRADPGGPIRQGPLHRRRIGVHGLVGGRVGIKIAVGAFGQAEGHMDIQADGLHPDHLQKKRAIPAVIGTV